MFRKRKFSEIPIDNYQQACHAVISGSYPRGKARAMNARVNHIAMVYGVIDHTKPNAHAAIDSLHALNSDWVSTITNRAVKRFLLAYIKNERAKALIRCDGVGALKKVGKRKYTKVRNGKKTRFIVSDHASLRIHERRCKRPSASEQIRKARGRVRQAIADDFKKRGKEFRKEDQYWCANPVRVGNSVWYDVFVTARQGKADVYVVITAFKIEVPVSKRRLKKEGIII